MPWGEGGECQKKDLGRICWRGAMSKLSIRVRYRIPIRIPTFYHGEILQNPSQNQKLTDPHGSHE